MQDLEFVDATIEYQELGSEGLILNDLKILDIIGAKIDYISTWQHCTQSGKAHYIEQPCCWKRGEVCHHHA